MTLAVTTTKDEILDGMVAALASAKLPNVGGTLYDVGRYMGRLDATNEVFQRGVANRCPAVICGFDSERRIHTTIGRRVDKVEGTYLAVCCSDSKRNRDDRKSVLATLETARRLLGARRYSLQIKPMVYQGTRTIRDDEKLLAIADVFTTRYHVDYTKAATYDLMASYEGEIVYVNADGTFPPAPTNPQFVVIGQDDNKDYQYRIVAEFSDGMLSNPSPILRVTHAPANLDAFSNFNAMGWDAPASYASGSVVAYHIYRTASNGSGNSGTIGLIGSTDSSTLFFIDQGTAGDGSSPFLRGVQMAETFPT